MRDRHRLAVTLGGTGRLRLEPTPKGGASLQTKRGSRSETFIFSVGCRRAVPAARETPPWRGVWWGRVRRPTPTSGQRMGGARAVSGGPSAQYGSFVPSSIAAGSRQGGRPVATASTSRAIVSRGHGQVPNASMDVRSMSTTITFRSDGAGLRSHWSPAAWTTLLRASQRSPAVRFDY